MNKKKMNDTSDEECLYNVYFEAILLVSSRKLSDILLYS